MSFLHRLLASADTPPPGPADDWWYQAAGSSVSVSGQRVTDQTARKLSAWYRGRDLLATALAMLPLPLLERLPNDQGSNQARGNPLYDVIHTQPNPWQDSFSWRRQKMYHLIDHGNGYDRIIEGPRGFVDQLRPIDPTLVTPEQISTARVLYHVRDPKTSLVKTYTQDEIFHLRGPSDDGVVGKGVLEYARDSLGIALATESYAGRLFSQGALHGGYIKTPGVMDPDAAKRMAATFVPNPNKWHMPKVLEQGSEWIESKLTPEDSQMLLSRKFSIDDIARWLGLPPHMIGSLERSTNNNIEHQGHEFVTYSLGQWLSLWEFAINSQLILRPDKYYAEFTRDALVRGDIAVRWAAHVNAVNAGIKSVDEVRRVENLNARGGKADDLRDPQNITGKPDAADPGDAPTRKQKPPGREDDDEPDDKARAIVTESSMRLLRKETTAAMKAASKFAGDLEAWEAWVTAFYVGHVELVAATMVLDEPSARLYCESQRDQLLESLAVLETWTPDFLVALSLDRPTRNPWQHQAELLAQHAPSVHVPVTIADGAIRVSSPVTVEGAEIQPAKVEVHAPTTIEKGAITYETRIEAKKTKTIVEKKIKRDAKGNLLSVTEEHTEKD